MIYLSKKNNSKNIFFLRVIKQIEKGAFEFDENNLPQFLPDQGGHLPNGEKVDLLKVWVKPVKSAFPSVLYSDVPIEPPNLTSSKKIKIKLINTKSKKVEDYVDFTYQKAVVECHLDNWIR